MPGGGASAGVTAFTRVGPKALLDEAERTGLASRLPRCDHHVIAPATTAATTRTTRRFRTEMRSGDGDVCLLAALLRLIGTRKIAGKDGCSNCGVQPRLCLERF